MTYTRTWSEVNNLLGSRDADEIDDASRETHVDLTERFADIVQDVNANPWKLKLPGLNPVDGTQSNPIPLTSGKMFGTTLEMIIADMAIQPTAISVGNSWVGEIIAPYGSVIKAIQARVLRTTAGATVSMKFRTVDSTGVNTDVSVVAAPVNAALQYITITGLNQPTNGLHCFVEVNLVADGSNANSARLLGVDVNFKPAGTY